MSNIKTDAARHFATLAGRTSARSIAAMIYDKDDLSEADTTFLDAVARADREYLDTLYAAKRDWTGEGEAWEAVKNLATRSRDKAYAAALLALEADEDEVFAEAAE